MSREGGGRQNPTKIIASLISVIKIVKYFGIVGGEGIGGGGAKILQNDNGPPLSIIKIVKYCSVWGEGHWGRQSPAKDNGTSSLCH